jgi:EAL domain-containing protein (putative c-di-GMP-specific phosphodiesterase class I)
MHHAKEAGSGQTAMFHPAMEVRAGSRLQLESDLRRALAADQFELRFQPIVSLDGGSIVGMESLLRWMHPVDGMVPPGRFIALAEETGLMVPLTRWVLARAVETLRRWQSEPAASDLYLSVNLSGRDLDEPGLSGFVADLLEGSALPTGALRIELTEGAVLRDFELAALRLGELHRLQVPLMLDDFGTGYSSLSYLHQLPFDFVKIDRSFIQRMGKPDGDTEMVRTIVELARHMRLGCVAEGIETDHEQALLRQVGCQFGQGFLYSKALPETEALRFVVDRPDARLGSSAG